MTELVAREGIRDLVARYNSNGDSGRFDQVVALFTEDAVMEVEGRTYRGREEIRSIFTVTRERVRSGLEPGYVRHFVSTHQIDLVDEASARGRCYYAVISSVGLDHWGRYIDEYGVVDGSWRFTRRRVTVDGSAPDSLVVGERQTERAPWLPSGPDAEHG
jgi:3-phenylpropionate/cinnamic acid dioxygenase small subunit